MRYLRTLLLCHVLFSLTAMVLLGCGCGKKKSLPPREIEIKSVCGVKFGEVYDPRNGEGKLLDITRIKPDIPHFSKISVEVTPFTHKVWRIVLIAPEIPGNDPLPAAAAELETRFRIKFKRAGFGGMTAELARQQVVLRRRLDWGPRACEAEFICKKGAAEAAKARKSAEFIEAQKQGIAFNDIVILQELAAVYLQQNGKYPANISMLKSVADGANVPLLDPWGEPYKLEIRSGKAVIKASRRIR